MKICMVKFREIIHFFLILAEHFGFGFYSQEELTKHILHETWKHVSVMCLLPLDQSHPTGQPSTIPCSLQVLSNRVTYCWVNRKRRERMKKHFLNSIFRCTGRQFSFASTLFAALTVAYQSKDNLSAVHFLSHMHGRSHYTLASYEWMERSRIYA